MAYVSKIWVDRQTEYPTRRKLEFDDGSSDKIVTVSREEGTIYAAGDTFDANTMNSLESRIAAGIAEKQDILIPGNGIRIDQDNVISATGGGGGIEFTKVESGSLVSVNDAADLPVVDLAVEIKATQSGTGDPSPSNVRPISGWTSVGVTRAEKNLLGGSLLLANAQAYLPSGTTDLTEKTFAFTSNLAVGAETGFTGGLTDKFKENTQYTLILTCRRSTSGSPSILIHYTDGTSVNFQAVTTEKATYAFVTASGKTVSKITKSDKAGTTTLYYEECGVFEGTLTASQFEPYTGTTVTIALGQTVYGGELDVTSGELKITWASRTFTGTSEESWGTGSSFDFRYNVSDMKSGRYMQFFADWLTTVGADAGTAPSIRFGASNTYIYLLNILSNIPTVTDLASFKTYLSTHPLQIVYELATPVTVQLTPTEIETLLGINNIWADSGDILNLEYYTQSASDVRDFIIKDDTVSDQSSWSSEKIQDELDAKQETLTAGDGIVISQNNEISAVLYKELTANLQPPATSVVFNDASITTSSTIDIYTSQYGFNPETVTVETGKIILTFRSVESSVGVKVRVS